MNVRRRVRDAVLVFAGVGLFSWMALSAADQKSPAFDEPPHITSAAAAVLEGDYRLVPETGVLVQRWLALPDLFWHPDVSALTGPDWAKSDVWKVDDAFLYGSANDAGALVWRARIMATALSALIGVVVFLWSRRVNGPLGGWISLTLFVFCPTMLAHGPLATADMTVTLFFALATWALWRLVHRISLFAILACAGAVGALVLSKFSGLIIVAVAGSMIVVRLAQRPTLTVALASKPRTIEGRGRVLAAFAVTAVIITVVVGASIWGAYGFRYGAFSPDASGTSAAFLVSWPQLVDPSSVAGRLLFWTRDHRLLPEAFVYGVAHTLGFGEARPAFLNGIYRTTGTWTFFPYAFMVKTPVPLLLLALGGVLATTRMGAASLGRGSSPEIRRDRSDLVPLWLLFGAYSLFAISSHLNIGHRYLLPLYPPLFIFAGGLARWLQPDSDAAGTGSKSLGKAPRARRRVPAAAPPAVSKRFRIAVGSVIATCLVWHVGESLRARPDYLAYMNELAGSAQDRYRHLVDSSLDWGQDLPGLSRWLHSHRSGSDRVYLSYFGTAPPDYYGISAIMLPALLDRRQPGPPIALTGGLYCISATMLQGVYLAAPGPWSDAYETEYQQLSHVVQAYESTAPNTPERAAADKAYGPDGWRRVFQLFEHFRAARLFASLRLREPDADIGHSILVFRVTEDDARKAQFGPPPS